MTKLLYAILGASLGIAGAAHAGDAGTTHAWSDSEIHSAMSKCEGLTGTEASRCIVNIQPQGRGRSPAATAVADEQVVKTGVPTEEEYMSAMKRCDTSDVADRDQCITDVKSRYGRM
jgi:hypothetical protein